MDVDVDVDVDLDLDLDLDLDDLSVISLAVDSDLNKYIVLCTMYYVLCTFYLVHRYTCTRYI